MDLAVSAARLAMKRNSPWRTMAPAERGLLLMKMADIIERDIEYIASLEVRVLIVPYKKVENIGSSNRTPTPLCSRDR